MSNSYVINYCQQLLFNYFPVILTTVFLLAITVGFISLILQLYITNRFIKKYLKNKVLLPDRLNKIVLKLNISGKVDVVESEEHTSFCYGLLSPRICLSLKLVSSLNIKELRAVLLHESSHLKNYDPLKMVISKTFSSMFLFIPILKDLQRHYIFTREIAADSLAVKNNGKAGLVSVLSKLLISNPPYFNLVATLDSGENLEKRILYLTGGQRKVVFKPSFLSISLSTFIVLFSMVLVNTPVYAVRADDSCKAKEEVNYSKDVIHTPANYTPK